MLHKTFGRILGCALLLHGGTALAFTLIDIAQLIPSATITGPLALPAQVQPIAGTIRAQIFGLRRPGSSKEVTQVGGMMLAANEYSGSASDVNVFAAAGDAPSGGGGGSGRGNSQSLWVSSTNDSLVNTFSRTEFYGATQNVLVGYDFTRSDKYVFGISGGYEASNFATKFNFGNEKTRGVNINPYFAWLLSDRWSLDVIGGIGRFNTHQSRTVGTGAGTSAAVDSDFWSKRGFAATNLTNMLTLGNWKLTGSLGYLWSKRDQDAYTENGPTASAVVGSKQTSGQLNLLGEAAYGRGNSETFFGAQYEENRNYQKIEFATGDQPANDPTSVLLSAGWRHFGRGLTASFVVNGRVAQDQVRGYGFAMVLRADL